jgi:hypothetical protein
MNKRQELFRLYMQRENNMDLNTAQGLSTDDFTTSMSLEVGDGSNMSPAVESEKIGVIAGAVISQAQAVPGMEKAGGSINVPLRGALGIYDSGDETFSFANPPWVDLMCVLCGFTANAIATSSEGPYSLVLTPNSNFTGGTIKTFSSPNSDGLSYTQLFYNLLADFTIEIEGTKGGKVTFTPTGAYGGEIGLDTQPEFAPVFDITPSFLNAQINILGDDWSLTKITIKGEQKYTNRMATESPNGAGGTEASDRTFSVSIKFYADPLLLDSGNISPMANFRAEGAGATALGAFCVSYGPAAGPQIIISSANYQMTKPTWDDEGGVRTWTVEGQLNLNDLTIAIQYTSLPVA